MDRTFVARPPCFTMHATRDCGDPAPMVGRRFRVGSKVRLACRPSAGPVPSALNLGIWMDFDARRSRCRGGVERLMNDASPGHWSPGDHPYAIAASEAQWWLSAVTLAEAPARPGRTWCRTGQLALGRCSQPQGFRRPRLNSAPQLRAMTRRVRRATGARSTEHWLVHPGGARTRGNGRQLEATDAGFTLRTVVHA